MHRRLFSHKTVAPNEYLLILRKCTSVYYDNSYAWIPEEIYMQCLDLAQTNQESLIPQYLYDRGIFGQSGSYVLWAHDFVRVAIGNDWIGGNARGLDSVNFEALPPHKGIVGLYACSAA